MGPGDPATRRGRPVHAQRGEDDWVEDGDGRVRRGARRLAALLATGALAGIVLLRISGENVKIDGVKVGTVGAVTPTPQAKGAVVLDITKPGFKDFRADASCTI